MDFAATTPLDPAVLEQMQPYLKGKYGNASSIHSMGQEAKVAIDEARETVADLLNGSASEIVFTGSATEANNLAIKGLVNKFEKPHVITTEFEHHAVLHPIEKLEEEDLIEVTHLSIGDKGLISTEQVEEALKENTVLVSIMYANNEIGTIQPIKEIGELLKDKNKERDQKIFFHTDAVQAANYLNCDVQELNVDLLSLSAHKFYGPKGVGALYVDEDVNLEPIILGGGHESGLRSGTENVAGIVGMGAAIERITDDHKRIKQLRNKLINGILNEISDVQLNGDREKRLPNNVNVSIKGIEGESIVISLDQKGIEASTGSACSTQSLKPSHVLTSLGLSPQEAHGSLRLTLGKYNNKQDIEKVLRVLPKVVKRLREISPF
ncbi:MAG: cysteine desulfurase family protein [Candidatus Paceibacterota bacterium]